MPNAPGVKNSKKEIEHSPDVPDFIIPEKTEVSPPVSPQELEKGREAVKREISEQAPTEKQKQGEGITSSPKASNTPVTPADAASIGSKVKSPELIQIENILEENMAEAFSSMDLATKTRFKQEGEITASRIEQAIRQTKIKIKEILDLIRNWLKIIPGVNKYFIEQEAKIKGDKITALKKNSNY